MSGSPHALGGLGIPASLSQVVDEDTELERHIPASRIVEVEAGERRAELFQKRHEFSSGNIRTESLFHAEGETCPGASGALHTTIPNGALRRVRCRNPNRFHDLAPYTLTRRPYVTVVGREACPQVGCTHSSFANEARYCARSSSAAVTKGSRFA